MIVGHHIPDGAEWVRVILAFSAFSFGASSVYVLNDILDLSNDRLDLHKRRRPLAAGHISVSQAWTLCLVFAAGASSLALVVGVPFFLMLIGYIGLSNAYSIALKKQPIVDVLVLASLYTWRLFAGGLVVHILPSTWLLAFSMFLFLSLAMLKRYSELQNAAVAGRGYLPDDIGWLSNTGIASGYMAVLVMALYINSREVTALYTHPSLLWLGCPILLYWITRMWFLAHRGLVAGDPIVVALRDRVSVSLGILMAVFMALASRLPDSVR